MPVQFLVGAHAWVAGQVPSEANNTLMFPSLSPSLPLSLKIKKSSLKKIWILAGKFMNCHSPSKANPPILRFYKASPQQEKHARLTEGLAQPLGSRRASQSQTSTLNSYAQLACNTLALPPRLPLGPPACHPSMGSGQVTEVCNGDTAHVFSIFPNNGHSVLWQSEDRQHCTR